MKIENIQKALDSVYCPNCEKGKLQAILRCDLDVSECLAEAECNNCFKSFHVNENTGDAASLVAVCDISGMECTIKAA